MSGNLAVTFQDLQEASSTLQTGSAEIEDRLAYMRNRLEPIHASWQGAAKGQFDALWQEWETSAMRLREALDGISQLMSTAASNYEEAERAIGQSFSQR
jgi:WXG100 family type VII secretion target